MYCHTRLHLGSSARLKIWQVPACKMEPRSGIISCNNPIHFTKVSELVQQNNHILNIGQMSDIFRVSCGALEGVWKMSGRCLDGTWKVFSPSGRCLKCVQEV